MTAAIDSLRDAYHRYVGGTLSVKSESVLVEGTIRVIEFVDEAILFTFTIERAVDLSVRGNPTVLEHDCPNPFPISHESDVAQIGAVLACQVGNTNIMIYPEDHDHA